MVVVLGRSVINQLGENSKEKQVNKKPHNFTLGFYFMLQSVDFFFKINSFRKTIRVSNSLDPLADQARHFVGPDLDPNCLEKLSAGDISRQRVNSQQADKTVSPRRFRLLLYHFNNTET